MKKKECMNEKIELNENKVAQSNIKDFLHCDRLWFLIESQHTPYVYYNIMQPQKLHHDMSQKFIIFAVFTILRKKI